MWNATDWQGTGSPGAPPNGCSTSLTDAPSIGAFVWPAPTISFTKVYYMIVDHEVVNLKVVGWHWCIAYCVGGAGETGAFAHTLSISVPVLG
jgi:hypothetical protein